MIPQEDSLAKPPFRALTRETAWVALTCLALTLAFLSPILRHWANWGIEDWDYWAFQHEAMRRTLLGYHQIPSWNPYYCGGTDLLAHPGSRLFALTTPLVLLLGPVAGFKLEFLLYAVAGMLGFHVLGRQLGLDRWSAWLAPIAYFLGPLYALPTTAGMVWFTSVAFLPWAFYFYLRAVAGGFRNLVACGACLVFMYFGGGAYPLAISFTFIGFFSLLGLREIGLARSASIVASLVVLTVLLGAVKLFPSIDFMREFPRRTEQSTGFSVESLGVGLFARDQRLEVASTRFGDLHRGEFLRGISADYDDVGMYVGPLIGALFALGLVVRGREHWKLATSFLVFLWLSFGDRVPLSPFELLHRLPVFESMRFAERFRLVWLLCALLLAGAGLQWIRASLARRFPGRPYAEIAACAVLAYALVDLYGVTRPIWEAAFPIAPMEFRAMPEFHQIAGLPNYDAHGFVPRPFGQTRIYGSWSAHYPALLMNVGGVGCYESAFVPRSPAPIRAKRYRGEVYLTGSTGSVTTMLWSPNRLRFSVRAESPGRLVVNQNYYRGWTARDGRTVSSQDGLLAVEVGPEDRLIELRYVRRSFVAGGLVGTASWGAVGLAVWRSKRQGPQSR